MGCTDLFSIFADLSSYDQENVLQWSSQIFNWDRL